MNRRRFLTGSVSLPLLAQRQRRPEWMSEKWKIDPRCVLPRGAKGEYDARVAGDPCIVWDDEVSTWRMFYFPSPGIGANEAPRGRIAGMALGRSAEEIGPGDWRKVGPAPVANPFEEIVKFNGHKFWVLLDPRAHNRAARIGGRYWGMFIVGRYKHVYAAWAERLAGPWTVVEKPILSPGQEHGAPDGRHCDTPTAYWMQDRKEALIYYMAYPRDAQAKQPGAPFGSSNVVAWWRPSDALARKANQVIVPGRNGDWNRGWAGGFQLLRDSRQNLWYALLNGSPTSPEDDSHREPAPSLGGWAVCKGKDPDGEWVVDNSVSPFVTTGELTPVEVQAGIGVNLWRHHLLVTPSGNARIFFNSGPYGTEQMYSLIPG